MFIRNSVVRSLALLLVGVLSASCGDVVRSSDSPSSLVINSFAPSNLVSDVIQNVTSPAPCTVATPCPTVFNDVASVSLGAIMKNVTVTAPTANNDITVTRYRVEYRRADGRNTPGVDVPYPFDGGVTVKVAVGGVSTVSFELVRHSAKEEPPLSDLVATGSIINTIAYITFYGTDQAGNDVSATGTMSINFGNVGN